ncbi:hypothetical protein VNI00_018978 [Paramarasmius palmivorus]|uniref:Zn(2)-C6 fungal-type domain-containing protein n=1 Tax=Paramarasmius palmivorus TaxID=297713 RepID=A0AAW0AS38_9AGAR
MRGPSDEVDSSPYDSHPRVAKHSGGPTSGIKYKSTSGLLPRAPDGGHSHGPSPHTRAYPVFQSTSELHALPRSMIYTSDMNVKLSDSVARQCFNCFATDTSTWRKSNLSPGKILCNKCGLFERTHDRPRPVLDQVLKCNPSKTSSLSTNERVLPDWAPPTPHLSRQLTPSPQATPGNSVLPDLRPPLDTQYTRLHSSSPPLYMSSLGDTLLPPAAEAVHARSLPPPTLDYAHPGSLDQITRHAQQSPTYTNSARPKSLSPPDAGQRQPRTSAISRLSKYTTLDNPSSMSSLGGSRAVDSERECTPPSQSQDPYSGPSPNFVQPLSHCERVSLAGDVIPPVVEKHRSRQKPKTESAPDQHTTTQGKRVYVACLQCRTRKIRCDGAKPACYNCTRRQNTCKCNYDTVPRRRGPGKIPGARRPPKLISSHSSSSSGSGSEYLESPITAPYQQATAQAGKPCGNFRSSTAKQDGVDISHKGDLAESMDSEESSRLSDTVNSKCEYIPEDIAYMSSSSRDTTPQAPDCRQVGNSKGISSLNITISEDPFRPLHPDLEIVISKEAEMPARGLEGSHGPEFMDNIAHLFDAIHGAWPWSWLDRICRTLPSWSPTISRGEKESQPSGLGWPGEYPDSKVIWTFQLGWQVDLGPEDIHSRYHPRIKEQPEGYELFKDAGPQFGDSRFLDTRRKRSFSSINVHIWWKIELGRGGYTCTIRIKDSVIIMRDQHETTNTGDHNRTDNGNSYNGSGPSDPTSSTPGSRLLLTQQQKRSVAGSASFAIFAILTMMTLIIVSTALVRPDSTSARGHLVPPEPPPLARAHLISTFKATVRYLVLDASGSSVLAFLVGQLINIAVLLTIVVPLLMYIAFWLRRLFGVLQWASD